MLLEVARKVEALAPDAFIINFTNPAGIVTEAVSRYSRAKIIGLCNVPVTMHHMIADMLQAPHDQVKLRFAGLNHMVWVHQVMQQGRDVTDQVIEMLCAGHALSMNNIQEVPARPFPARAQRDSLPLSPLLLANPRHAGGRDRSGRCKGTRAEQVMKVEEELFRLYADPQRDRKPEQLNFRGGAFYSEVAVDLIRNIHTNSGREMVVNCRNNGAIQGLPDDAVVETNCLIDALGAHPLAFGRLPPAMNGLTQQVKISSA